eukprot:4359100-Pyramimonas_sp.AAC.1
MGCRVGRLEREGARFWDKAVRGSSALRAAIARQFQLEVSTIQGFSWAEIPMDLEKFYDHLQRFEIFRLAKATGYP